MRSLIVSAALAAIVFGGTSAALAAGMQSSQSSQNAAYCLKSSSGTPECKYQTMAQCEQAKTGSEQCISNPSATTGSSSMSGSSSSTSPSSSMQKK